MSISKFRQAVDNAKQQIKQVTVQQAKRLLDEQTHIILIDTREDSEWQNGHVPKAIHIGKGVLERDIEQHVPDEDIPIIIYCGGGSRSALAAMSLQVMGYTQVMSMAGGYRGWLEAGLPIEKP